MNRQLHKTYLRYKDSSGRLSLWEKAAIGLTGALLSPVYWFLAYFHRTPGLQFRRYFLGKALRLALRHGSLDTAYRLIVMPLDSFRYFEFDFMWRSIQGEKIRRYLDVSSPRLFPLMVTDRKADAEEIHLINPDQRDLGKTEELAKELGLDGHCHFHPELISDVKFAPASFDLITCMSVLEHITDDTGAVAKLWELLAPGGRLLLTIPCARTAQEEYMNQDDYQLGSLGNEEFLFFQRFYDQDLLDSRIYSITGQPVRQQIYAEKFAGIYQQNETRKREDKFFPTWRAPFDMGRQYKYKSDLAQLSGIGVIGLEFIKR